MAELNKTAKQGFFIRGEFDRLVAETVQKKDGTTFPKYTVYLIVQGTNRTTVSQISVRKPEKWATLQRGEAVEVEFYLSPRVYQGQVYITFYEVD